MEIKVMYFAALREIMNQSSATIKLETAESAEQVARRLVGQTDCLLYAVNDEVVPSDHPLNDGDTLALIPPMAGG